MREIDRLVAEHVMGWERLDDLLVPPKGHPARDNNWAAEWDEHGCPHWMPQFSSDISATWGVVEKLTAAESTLHMPIFNLRHTAELKGRYAYIRWVVTYAPSSGPGVDLTKELVEVSAETAPLAICLAALKAKGITPSSPASDS